MRILLIDDSVDNVRMVSLLFDGLEGFEVRSLDDARLACETAAEFLPDAICLDIGMPYMDGYKVAREIRKCPDLANVAIVAVSGFAEDPVERKAAEIDTYLLKPVDFHLLAKAVRDAVAARMS